MVFGFSRLGMKSAKREVPIRGNIMHTTLTGSKGVYCSSSHLLP